MKSTTHVTTLTRVMAVVAPVVVFGCLYVLKVQPERDAADASRSELATALDELHHRSSIVRPQVAVSERSALDEFDARTIEGNRVPAVGGASNLSIERGAPSDVPGDSFVRLFSRAVVQTPVTMTFDAQYEQIARFFRDLRARPTAFELQSVELTPLTASEGGLTRAKVSLLLFHRAETAEARQPPRRPMVDVRPPPDPARGPDPVVSGILFSSGRRVALVDGVVVARGDAVRAGVVLSIEPDAVVIAEPGGRVRRVEISRPERRASKR